MAAGMSINSFQQTNMQTQSAISSPTNSRMTATSIQEQQLEDRIRILELQINQRHDSTSPSASTASTEATSKSLRKADFETVMAQQMQMIAALAESNKKANKQMEQQMGLITNLQQTVADLVL